MGGLNQLSLQGQNDIILTGNPQMTFFKTVYRRHTYFSCEVVELKETNNTNTLNFNDTTDLNFKLKRDADLIGNVYLTFDIPDIYSGEIVNTNTNTLNYPLEFKWIKNLGTSIIEKARMTVNSFILNEFTADSLNILGEVNYDDSSKKIYDEMIGNIPEIYNPTGNELNDNYYAQITTQSQNAVNNEVYNNNDFYYKTLSGPQGTTTTKAVQVLRSGGDFYDNMVYDQKKKVGR